MTEAKAAYERSLELDPCDPWTHLNLGNWHYMMKEYRQAVKCFKRGARLIPDEATPFVCLADAFAALGFDALATEAYRRALDIDPNNPMANRHWERWQRRCEPEG